MGMKFSVELDMAEIAIMREICTKHSVNALFRQDNGRIYADYVTDFATSVKMAEELEG